MFIFPKKKKTKIQIKTKKKYFLFGKGPDKVWPCSYQGWRIKVT